jgi:hypothetical protein
MDVIKGLAGWMASSRLNGFIEVVRFGWNNYSFIFYIGGISAILGGIFGWAGWASTIVTLLFFYYAGKLKRQIDAEKRRIARGGKPLKEYYARKLRRQIAAEKRRIERNRKLLKEQRILNRHD